jgi:hypothetical protein
MATDEQVQAIREQRTRQERRLPRLTASEVVGGVVLWIVAAALIASLWPASGIAVLATLVLEQAHRRRRG